LIDAYAAALSLDAAVLPTPQSAPVRLAILDWDDNGVFDENDLAAFVFAYFDPSTGQPLEPTSPDFSRFDLNGDGFTGGSRTDRFDLDRVGSTQFGQTLYSTVTQLIEGQTISFNENTLTDLQILCYYAYSALYTGDPDVRKQLLPNCTCASSSPSAMRTAQSDGQTTCIQVVVSPATVTLAQAQAEQFAAQVTGAQDVRVTWAVDGVSDGNSNVGRISSSGLYTAPSTAGTHTVRAISVADPSAFGEATVTVIATAVSGAYDGTLTLCFNADTCVDPFPLRTLIFSRGGGEFGMQEGGTCSKAFLITFAGDGRSFGGVQTECSGGAVIPGSHTVVEGTLNGSHLTYVVFDDRDPTKRALGSESFDGDFACSVPISSGCPG